MKRLSKWEKKEIICNTHLSWFELRDRAAIYLNAIRTENKEVVDYFESLGSDVYKILYNHHTIEYHQLKPFQIIFNNRGYIEGNITKHLEPGKQIEIEF